MDGPDTPDETSGLRALAAQACRILAREGLVTGILGHVSARVPGRDEILIRCRGPAERGLHATGPDDIRLMSLEGDLAEPGDGWSVPKEFPIHAALLRARPGVGAVVHAHPPAALLCGLAGLPLRPVIGAYNIPALHLALTGIPVYPRSVLISRMELAQEMLAAMGPADVCLLRGHGITVAGRTVQEATVRAVNVEALCSITVELARLGQPVADVPAEDLAELPDLGGHFNTELAWNSLARE
jgi:ribulose-5-phosphate 4-epimerase/fuculose-1-phosphate aldolase